MNCEQALEAMSARLDGELDAQQTQALEAHLAQCPECRRLFDELSRIDGAIPSLDAEAPEALTARVMEQVRREPRRAERRFPWLAGALAAAAVFLLDLRLRRSGRLTSGWQQAAGLAALTQRDYVRQVRALIETERPYLLAGLRALGLRVIAGRANYLLFRADETLGERLEARGALIRRCGNYPGLDDTWYRTAVRTRRENDALLAALREVLA